MGVVFEFVVFTVEMIEPVKINEILDLLILFIWTIDIGLSFVTGIHDDGKLYRDFRTVFFKYMKSWFLLDLVTVIPKFVLLSSQQDGSLAQNTSIFKLLKMLRILR